MYQKLRRALDLCGRRKPIPDEAEILELGLDLLVAKLEKKKFAATDRPRAPRARTFGKQFMEQKREQARAAAAKRKAEKEAEGEQAKATAAERRKADRAAEKAARKAAAEAAEKADREAREQEEFLWWMERLGYSAKESLFAAEHCPRKPGTAPQTQRLECVEFLRRRGIEGHVPACWS